MHPPSQAERTTFLLDPATKKIENKPAEIANTPSAPASDPSQEARLKPFRVVERRKLPSRAVAGKSKGEFDRRSWKNQFASLATNLREAAAIRRIEAAMSLGSSKESKPGQMARLIARARKLMSKSTLGCLSALNATSFPGSSS